MYSVVIRTEVAPGEQKGSNDLVCVWHLRAVRQAVRQIMLDTSAGVDV